MHFILTLTTFAASLESSTVYSILSQSRRRHDHSYNQLKMFESSSIIRTILTHFGNIMKKQTVAFEVHLPPINVSGSLYENLHHHFDHKSTASVIINCDKEC